MRCRGSTPAYAQRHTPLLASVVLPTRCHLLLPRADLRLPRSTYMVRQDRQEVICTPTARPGDATKIVRQGRKEFPPCPRNSSTTSHARRLRSALLRCTKISTTGDPWHVEQSCLSAECTTCMGHCLHSTPALGVTRPHSFNASSAPCPIWLGQNVFCSPPAPWT